MKRRLYFVWPDVAAAKRAEATLLLQRVGSRHIRCLAGRGTDLAGLQEASIFQVSELIPSLRRGAVGGALTGVLAALFGSLLRVGSGEMALSGFPPIAYLVLAVAGALVGAWSASFIGISAPRRQLRAFDRDLAAGRVLMLVDVADHRAAEIQAVLGRPVPEEVRLDRHLPAFS
jgi:hypothetical protein